MSYPELNPGYGILPIEHQRSICQLRCWYENDSKDPATRIGTGFLYHLTENAAWLSTAAHLLYNHDLKKQASRVEVNFGRSGNSAFRQVILEDSVQERCFVPQEFVAGNDGSSEFDFGLLKILGKLRNINTIPCSWGDPIQSKVKLIGYPCEDSHGDDPYHAILEIEENGQDNFDYIYQMTYEGMSGGPLLARTGGDKTIKAFGMHIRGQSESPRAIRFSGPVQMRMREWTT